MLTVIFIQSDAKDSLSTHRTLDLTSSLEVGPATNHAAGDVPSCHYSRSVLTIAFQFPFDSSLQDNVATMARQYVRSVISSVQRVAMAISPTGLSPAMGPKLSPGSPEALTLAHWICQSYRWVLLWFLIMWLGCVTLWLALQNPLNTKKWMLNFFLSSWSTIFCWADIKCFNIGPSNIFLCKLVNYILYFFPQLPYRCRLAEIWFSGWWFGVETFMESPGCHFVLFIKGTDSSRKHTFFLYFDGTVVEFI